MDRIRVVEEHFEEVSAGDERCPQIIDSNVIPIVEVLVEVEGYSRRWCFNEDDPPSRPERVIQVGAGHEHATITVRDCGDDVGVVTLVPIDARCRLEAILNEFSCRVEHGSGYVNR